ncbi:MAG: biopolymer transporter ExbD [Prevotellaceae bacterium]|jgi:biopolymer transport protein ExbD|nr:biopolymer transporter ExbD [Prevotellaceae bacterium]
MAIKRTSKVNSGFSMASMTDIVFLLLIFFLVTSTLINPNALRLLLPKSNSQTPDKPKVSVAIKHLGENKFEFYVKNKLVTIDEIEDKLRLEFAAYTNDDDRIVSIFADKTVTVEQLVKILNIASRNKYRPILATSPE